jgi:hypothetical protein
MKNIERNCSSAPKSSFANRFPLLKTFCFTSIRLMLGGAAILVTTSVSAQTSNRPAESLTEIEFFDSATGYAIQPESITVESQEAQRPARHFGKGNVNKAGRAQLLLERGRHTITASSSKYFPLSSSLQVKENVPYRIHVLLDPIEVPEELKSETIIAKHRDDSTLIQGFIVDEESHQPLSGVRVHSQPSGVKTSSDARGYFQLHVPVQSRKEKLSTPASLIFEKPGYQTKERQYLELWPRGDSTYKIRLQRGTGREVLDERTLRHNNSYDDDSTVDSSNEKPAVVAKENSLFTLQSTVASNATVRVPRNIRVEKQDIVYYVTFDYYLKHVLPSEWVRSWNTNSLNAGAVAIRSYAILRYENTDPSADWDICGSSSCQQFDPDDTATSTDAAIDFTENCVMIDSNEKIVSTEYASENNSLDKPCGDGYTAPIGGCLYDPICAGKTRDGHGRGMCQRGSNRWANGDNGFPAHDWTWILQHYYPDLFLVRGAVLVIGDDVKARTASNCQVRQCGYGGISDGIDCPLITTRAAGDVGVIIDGPRIATNDNKHFTWYKVQWSDSVVGWSCENYLLRSLPSKITQWTFNSVTNDENTSTGVTTPSIGSGTMTLSSVTANGFNFGSTLDPASLGTDNSSRALQGPSNSSVANKTGGPQFVASTEGYTNIVVSWELWTAARASAYWRGQYTTNGTTWIDHVKVDKRTPFLENGGATFTSHLDDLTGVAGVANNPNFAYRIVAEYESTATGSGSAAYVPTDPNDPSGYNNTGPFRVDLVRIMGKEISQAKMALSNPSLGIQKISGSGSTQNVMIQWQTVPGKTYEVQYTSDLSGGLWYKLTDITAEKSLSSVPDVLPAGELQRFYRLLVK